MKYKTRKVPYRISAEWRKEFYQGFFERCEVFLSNGIVLPEFEDFLKTEQRYDLDTYLTYRQNCYNGLAFCYGVAAAVWFKRYCQEKGVI